MLSLIEIVISFLFLCGTFFIFSSSIGLLRFPDVYSRIHAASKSATLGVAGVLLGAFLFFLAEDGRFSGKLLLGILFVLLTSPISGHLISRAAYRAGVPLWKHSVVDDLKRHLNETQLHQKE